MLELEKENKIFADKSCLDNLTFPKKILGREEKTKELARKLYGYKTGYVVPFTSIYGRSGCGKSTLVRFVCENLPDVSSALVNLRKSRTVFGCANLILAELGEPNVKSSQGIQTAVERIGGIIEDRMKKEKTKCFVLVLDEFDVLFEDKRGKPSDFVYKLVTMEERLRAKGYLVCIITISNNVASDYDLDDRVLSRIGQNEVFFEAYTKDDVLKILSDRAKRALAKMPDSEVLRYCAEKSADEHGDARRAIDLLRVASELASRKNEEISQNHVDLASEELDKERITDILSGASYHLQTICAALVRLTFLYNQIWFSTSDIHNIYKRLVIPTKIPLKYRRVSGLLKELVVSGIIEPYNSSKGRYGQNTEFRLKYPAEIVGPILGPQWWAKLKHRKEEREKELQKRSERREERRNSLKFMKRWHEFIDKEKDDNWNALKEGKEEL